MRSRAWPLLLAVLCATAHASSTPARPRSDALLTEVLDLSGTRRMLEQVPQQVLASTTADKDRLPPDVRAKLAGALAESYRADRLYRTAFDYLKRTARPDELAAALDMLRAPLTLRFTEMEVEAGAPEAQAQLPAYVESLAKQPPTRPRFELVDRLDALTGSSALLAEIAVQTAAAVGRGVATARAPLTKAQEQDLADMVTRMRRDAAPATRQQVITMFLFTYRKASDDDLARYVALYDGGAGRWVARTTGQALRAALEQAAVDLARRLTEKDGPLAR